MPAIRKPNSTNYNSELKASKIKEDERYKLGFRAGEDIKYSYADDKNGKSDPFELEVGGIQPILLDSEGVIGGIRFKGETDE